MQNLGRTNSAKPIFWGLMALALSLFFAVALIMQGRVNEFAQFILDRRQTAGQKGPDPAALCDYDIVSGSLKVKRKSHAQKKELSFELTGDYRDSTFAGQNASISSTKKIATFNCANAELLEHDLAGERTSVLKMLFSGSGNNLAVLSQSGDKNIVEVFQFRLDPGDSRWNNNLAGSGTFALSAKPVSVIKMSGESLFFATQDSSKTFLNTYNFRRSHSSTPLNGWDFQGKPYAVLGKIKAGSGFDKLGKIITVQINNNGRTQKYSYDFSCHLVKADQVPPSQRAKIAKKRTEKPCSWKRE